MRKLIMLLLFLFFVYFIIQLGFKYFDKGHSVTYKVGTEISAEIEETFSQNKKGQNNNYYFKININNNVFELQTYQEMNKADRVIEDVKYFNEDGYQCIYPISKKRFTDVVCLQNGTYQYYHNLVSKSASLDKFVASLPNYNLSDYQDPKIGETSGPTMTVYKNNYVPKHYVALETYKGINVFSKENLVIINSLSLFSNDIYKRPISVYIGNYYITADYQQQYNFHDFFLLNITTGEKSTITYNGDISFDSYIQGIVGNKVYFFDRNSKKQYEIDLKTKTVIEIGNVDLGIKIYKDGSFITGNAYDAYNNNLTFSTYQTTNNLNGKSYERVDKVGNETSGYYYLYEKVLEDYYVYRCSVINPSIRTYLFKTPDISKISYVDDYVYFIDGNSLNYYHDLTGVRTIVNNTELSFNTELKLGAVRK